MAKKTQHDRKDFENGVFDNPVSKPFKEIDPEKVKVLAARGCTKSEVAAVLDCHRETIINNYSWAYDEGKERGRAKLRKMQWDTAEAGNPALLIWLGKQILNQKDKQELSGKLSKPKKQVLKLGKRTVEIG